MAVQRVRRVIRKIDPWTVLKVSIIFNAIMALVFVLGTIVFWAIFVNAGIPQRINELALLIGLENGINLEGAVYFRIVILLAVIGTILFTGFVTLGAVVYNLISDIVGGIEFIVLEDSTPTGRSKAKVAMPVAPPRSSPGRIIPELRRSPAATGRPPAEPHPSAASSPVATKTAESTHDSEDPTKEE